MTGWLPPFTTWMYVCVHRKEVRRMTVYEVISLVIGALALFTAALNAWFAFLAYVEKRRKK